VAGVDKDSALFVTDGGKRKQNISIFGNGGGHWVGVVPDEKSSVLVSTDGAKEG
jgi:hypothetical protein